MPVTTADLAAWKQRRERFVMLTAYDALTARVLDEAGVPLLLVGDSLGNNVLGYDSTIPVMGHLGFTPQSANAFGRRVVRGRGEEGDELLADALALQEAGCFSIVLEAVPAELGARVTEALEVATIGIGAGPACDGQVLVITDLLGLTPDPTPRFVKRYADLRATIAEAATRFTKDVAEGHYPGPEHQYH